MTPPEYYETVDALCDLLRQQIKLYGELKRAIRIADLLGVKPSELTGKVVPHVISSSRRHRRWVYDEFTVSRDGKEVFRAKLIDVHQDLWPDDVRNEYRIWKQRAASMRGAYTTKETTNVHE